MLVMSVYVLRKSQILVEHRSLCDLGHKGTLQMAEEKGLKHSGAAKKKGLSKKAKEILERIAKLTGKLKEGETL